MSYDTDASNCALQIGQIVRDSKTQHQKAVKDIRGVSNYWKGEAYDAFQKKYANIDQDIQDMHDCMNNTAAAMKNLKKAIDMADNERMLEAANK